MDLKIGFQLEDPDVMVPWSISPVELEQLIVSSSLERVTEGYYTTPVQCLGGLRCMLGFHFEPPQEGMLQELEFFRSRSSHYSQFGSFEEFQRHFEAAFGRPTRASQSSEEFPSYTWALEDATIVHYVVDRFGPEEHMRIRGKRRPAA